MFYSGMMALALLGIADALNVWMGWLPEWRHAFSLLEVVCVPIGMLAVAMLSRAGESIGAPTLFLLYQAGAWLLGQFWLTADEGAGLQIPDWFILLAGLFYTLLLQLSWQQIRRQTRA